MSAAVPSMPGTRRFALLRHGRLLTGAILTGALVAVALLSLLWTPEVPTRLRILAKLKPPLSEGLLGTDQLGRDILSLLMVGTANSLSIAVAAVVLGAATGTLIGIVAAMRRGALDALLMRMMDAVFAFPPILSAMMLSALLGSGRLNATVAIGLFTVPVFARLARADTKRILRRDYILAARGAGKNAARIAVDHVLPNIAGAILVQVTIQLGLAILTESGLGFLGLSISPPAPSLGRMLADAQTYLTLAPWMALAPGITIALIVAGFNLLGDGLRDRLDVRRDVSA
ncbi:ABC transporter permease [Mangrovicella endophytica]|uniref:ABC transporter permease n=1 Tax=Mangrovicella endophytica TaxID=2066697 RepID=UPI000C9E397A|nr:ABC transporter permease [Mangrovicella endophytica]